MLAAFGLVLARAREGGAVTTSPTPAPEAEAGAAGLAAGAKNESGTCTPERETCVLASDIKDICHDVASDVVFQTTCDGAAPPLPQSGELNFSVAIFLSIMTFVVLLAALLLQVRVLLSGQAAAARANTLLIILAVAGGVLVLLKSVMDFYGGPDGNLFTALINFLLEWTNGVADAREWSFLSEFVTEILVVATGLVTTNYAATKVGGQRKAANRRETSRENSAKDEQIEALELALAIKDTNARIDKGNVVDMKSLLERVRAAEAHATAAEARAAAAESISAGETAEAATQSEEASVAHLARVADAEARAMAAEARRDAAEERAATAGVAETKAHAEAEAAQATVAGMEDQKARAEKAEAEAAAANMATVKAEVCRTLARTNRRTASLHSTARVRCSMPAHLGRPNSRHPSASSTS